MVKKLTMPIQVGPQFSAGDPTLVPEGFCLRVRNYLLRPNRLESRSPFVYDSLMNVRGLCVYDDNTNKVFRLLAIDSAFHPYEKAVSGEVFSASLGTLSGTRLTDAANYRGVIYGMMDDGAGLPAAAFSFDGTNLNVAPFNSAIQSRAVTAYLDRLFFAYPRVPVANQHQVIADVYGPSAAAGAVMRTITNGTNIIQRLYQTGAVITTGATWGFLIVTNSGPKDAPYTWRTDIRNNDTTQQVPLKLYVQLSTNDIFDDLTAAPSRTQAVTVGTIGRFVGGGVGRIFRCTVAGTTAGAAPAFGTVLGATIVDGTVTWLCDRDVIIATKDVFLPAAADTAQWTTTYLDIGIPFAANAQLLIRGLLQLGNASAAAPATWNLDLSLKDGLTDGDPRKKNYGSQFTAGDFRFPFFNQESSLTATVDLNTIIWSESLDPKRIRASATYDLHEIPGYPTAATVLSGRYLCFKRTAFWIFAGNQDDNTLDVIPIRKEDQKNSVGCLGPRALDTLDNTVYFIAEDGIYSYSPLAGAANYQAKGGLEELGGDGMREEIMARGANWVESQATYNMPILRVNKKERELWVYTQKGTIYVYNIARQGWTTIDVNSAEVADMFYNPNTRKMYVAFGGFGLARHDWNAANANDTIDNTGTTYPATRDIVTRPIELYADRMDATVDNVGVFVPSVLASQSGQVMTASASFDRGATFPWSNPVTLDVTTPRNQIDLYENGPSVTIKLSYVGKAGASTIAISKLDAKLLIFGGEWPQVIPASAGTAVL